MLDVGVEVDAVDQRDLLDVLLNASVHDPFRDLVDVLGQSHSILVGKTGCLISELFGHLEPEDFQKLELVHSKDDSSCEASRHIVHQLEGFVQLGLDQLCHQRCLKELVDGSASSHLEITMRDHSEQLLLVFLGHCREFRFGPYLLSLLVVIARSHESESVPQQIVVLFLQATILLGSHQALANHSEHD